MTTSGGRKKRRSRALLPVLGLMLALCFGVVAYFVAPILIEFGEEQSPGLKDSFDDIRANPDYPENSVDYIAAGLIWLVLMALTMFIAAAAVGEDPDKETWRLMGPPPADKDAVIKQLRKDLKAAKKRERQRNK